MPNFKEDLLEVIRDEAVVGVQIRGSRGGCNWSSRDAIDHPFGDNVVPWEEAAQYLDYEYDSGYGGQDCHDVYIWTPTRVISVWEYDGSTWPYSIPRNPPGGEI